MSLPKVCVCLWPSSFLSQFLGGEKQILWKTLILGISHHQIGGVGEAASTSVLTNSPSGCLHHPHLISTLVLLIQQKDVVSVAFIHYILLNLSFL